MGNSSSLSETQLRQCANKALQTAKVEELHLVDMKSFHRVPIASDNSCLFTTVSCIINVPGLDAFALRQIVANEIKRNPTHYSADILGMPRHKYITWILKPTSWGGYIELAILANYFKVRLVAIDIQTMHPHHFPDPGEADRVRLLSGDHRSLHVQAISVPGTEIRHQSGSSFVMYRIELRLDDVHWTIHRRFREINELDGKLRQLYPAFGAKLPPKTFTNCLDGAFIEQRRQALALYFTQLVAAGFPTCTPEFKAFLQGREVPPSLCGDAGHPPELFFAYTGFLLHDGVHYDLVAARSFVNNRPLTIFHNDQGAMDAALALARGLRQRQGSTDVDELVMECSVCRQVVKGQQGARTHAAQTGHAHFDEVCPLAGAL